MRILLVLALWLSRALARSVQGAFQTTLGESEAPEPPWRWSRVAAAGALPKSRQGHAAVEFKKRVYVVGGCLQEIECYSDVHEFDAEKLTWNSLKLQGDAPEPRGGHSATVIGHDLVIYGGANSEETFGDVYVLNLVNHQWRRLPTSGPSGSNGPGRRTGHASAAGARGEMFVFGGYDADGEFLNDLWVLTRNDEGGSAAWSRLEPSGRVPTAREAHSLTYIDGKLVLFGGYTAAGVTVNDAYAYDVQTQRWSHLKVAGALPPRRQAHAAVRHGRKLVIAGGCDVSASRPVCFADVWSLNLASMRWDQRSSDLATWVPREGHSATFVRGRMFAFGGCDLSSSCFNDITALDTDDPCPDECGSHGTCVEGAFCQCTALGFTGHDCMQPLTCPEDCGSHGTCSQDGQCVCENGWSGPSCATELQCPGAPAKCSGRGLCLTDGSCQCTTGYMGQACDVPASGCPAGCSGNGACGADSRCVCNPGFSGDACEIVAAVASAAGRASVSRSPAAKRLALLDPFARAHHASSKSSSEQAPPVIRDFGVQHLNSNGRSGFQAACPEACNFRGLCDSGVCYCQPGFHGETCGRRQESSRGSVTLVVGLGIAAACFVVSFLVMMIPVHLNAKHKQQAEAQAGYNI
eukprot:TRINITY_DN40421_c0_g1_i1.p1 TRINITY_DN40421_c0_g1~~TRINITY_DN40421_c0_g1_i1.p1  ORF type:complete len:635 (+),score=81.80 TRINITY_DN40421_c0_g1_i1:41-1945(+)